MHEKSELVRRSEGELCRNRDLSAKLFDLESKARHAEDNLCVARKEQEELRFSNNSLEARNTDCTNEIAALQSHCNVLTHQNTELNAELTRFVETDEQIRCTLNRRDRVEGLRMRTEAEFRASRDAVERASPRRRI